MAIYRVNYRSDTLWVKGYLGIPNATTDRPSLSSNTNQHGRLPGLVYCRGGFGRVGQVKLDWLRAFVERGYVVFAPLYRGNEGGEGNDEFGGADCEDCCAAVRLLRHLPFVDSEQVSVMGFSRGAINAFRTAILEPNIKGLILWGGVADLAATYVERPELQKMLRRVLRGSPQTAAAAYSVRSAISQVHAISCPTLLVHGTADVQVDVRHARKLYIAMRAANKSVTAHLYEGYGHHLPEPVFSAVVERWLDWLKALQISEKSCAKSAAKN